MTIRAVILGLLGAMFIAAVGYLNDHVWLLTQFVACHLPIFVFGSLVLLVLLINPALFALRRKWRLSSAEIAVSTMLMLVVCAIPNYGLLGAMSKGMAIPAQLYRSQPGWQKNQLREYLPDHLLPAKGEYVPEFTDGFMQGGRAQDQNIAIADVPWHYWQETLVTWMPMVFLVAVAVICMGLILHRQWTTAERLRYPIADIASSLIQQEPDRAGSALLRTHMFWWGLALILFIRIMNGIYAYFPEGWIQIDLQLPFYQVANRFQILKQADMWWWAWLGQTLYPTIIAIAFLLASEVSLSLGLAPILFAIASIFCMKSFDVNIGKDDYMLGGPSAFQRFGSYLAMALVIGYTGRRYYTDVLKKAVTFRSKHEVPDYAAWACRILIISVITLVFLLAAMGLDWPFALLCVFLILLIHLGMTRINCESGMFLNLPRWQPLGVLVGLFGATAMGPQAIMIVGLLSVVFTIAPWESLMPFFMNGLKLCSDQKIKPARVGVGATGAYALGLLVAVPVVLWAIHNYGVMREPPQWSTKELPSYYYEAGDKKVNELKNEVQLAKSEQLSTWERVASIDPESTFVRSALVGVGLVLVVSFLRLRLPWWPIHPVLFMIWGTRQISEISASFLLGWMIKSAITNLGGSQTYQRTKSLMFGIIAGDLFGGFVFMVIGMVYHLVTDKVAPEYFIFPIMK